MPRRTETLLPVPPAYDSRARMVTFFSAALGIYKNFYIYIPRDLHPAQRVPTLYFLRGHEREWINPHEDTTRGDANVIDVYERLRAAGAIGPLLLVFPNMASDDNRVPGLLVNMLAPQRADASGIGSGRFADYFFNDLIPYVDTQFPALADRRGLAGFSLGGAMAVKAAAQRPDLFLSASAYDGTFLYAVDRGRRVRRTDPVIRNPMFDASYDVPRNTRFIAANSPANLILRGDATALGRITWMIGYGPEHREPWHANFYRGEHLVQCLQARGLANALPHSAFPDGDHTWRTADSFSTLALPLHDHALQAPQKAPVEY
ncbi:MAG TPA: alpha/beta hydrolase-fold protein [Roseiflexaceae bacterium]|nr:alpha/beta hydrolase-fold protein [Roseiflexaceae bacterium]